ncbi:MAG: alpha-2-macroglobulin [Prevotella sp.]|nr:alpha-2-macroglobulin [Prevotella sp.]
MNLSSQTLNALWKRHADAVSKDLPRTQIEVLDSIIDLATAQKQYGHLVKAQLNHVDAVTLITPDSLESEVKRLVDAEKAASARQPVLAAVYQSVLGQVYLRNDDLDENSDEIAKDYIARSLSNPALLASTNAGDWEPLTVKGKDSQYFNHDLLSVLAFQADNYALLQDYYQKQGNRKAACIAAAYNLREQESQLSKARLMEMVDSLLNVYGDLDEAGELAILKYDLMANSSDVTAADRVAYIDRMVAKYDNWPRIATLKNSRQTLIQKRFSYSTDARVMLPNKEQPVTIDLIRHLNSLTLRVWRLDIDPDEDYSLYNEKELQKVFKKIVSGTEKTIRHDYNGHPDYEVFEDTIMLPPLTPGVYLMNVKGDEADGEKLSTSRTLQDWHIFYVSDVYLISEPLPDNKCRVAVVSATTGKPLPGAYVKVKARSRNQKDLLLQCDRKGETVANFQDYRYADVKAYTKTDDFCPSQSMWSQPYQFNQVAHERKTVNIFTDRAIYRPGQTVHFALVSVVNYDGKRAQAIANDTLDVTLRDCNNQKVETIRVVTDEFGKADGKFTLPVGGLTGRFQIVTQHNASRDIRVEEYKRPTFEVEIDPYEEAYKNGDTITVVGHAKTFSGVPVQGARVSYNVTRRQPTWWRWDDDNDELLFTGETTTDEKGEFRMTVPVIMPENADDSAVPLWRSRSYNIVTDALVTDQGGESHEASLSLPVGNKATHLSFSLPERSEVEKFKTVRFSLRNIAGKPVDGEVTYYIDNRPEAYTAPANTDVTLPVPAEKLGSGKHTIKAICQGDTVSRDIVLFTLADKRPPIETHDWFYTTASQFPADGSPVYVQLGTTDPDTYVFYNVFADDRMLESGTMTLNRANNTKAWKYKEEYGNGVLLTFAWVKDGQFYSHHHTIAKPQVDRSIHLTWETFRDRLTPGQEEEWTLKATYADGTPADARLIATLYDGSLDQFTSHYWWFRDLMTSPLPYTYWREYMPGGFQGNSTLPIRHLPIPNLEFTRFENDLFDFYAPRQYMYTKSLSSLRTRGRAMADGGAVIQEEVMMEMAAPMAAAEASADFALDKDAEETSNSVQKVYDIAPTPQPAEAGGDGGSQTLQVRENLDETAFFMPSVVADEQGHMALRFRLPESVTTWQFMGLATDRDANSGRIGGESVAQKEVMVVPNVPRFVRVGDKAQVSARVINTTDHPLKGTAIMQLVDPETDAVCYEQKKDFSLAASQTQGVTFDYTVADGNALLVCKVVAQGDGFSDGEQHYLPVLPDREMVTVTRPITQHGPQTTTVDLTQLFPKGSTNGKLTVEYTNNPAWLMIQALPSMAEVTSDNAISLAATYYANAIGEHLMTLTPRIKDIVGQWEKENTAEGSLTSHLARNEELKDLLLNETPWVTKADKEESQMKGLSTYFNSSLISSRLTKALEKLEKLQLGDGSWTWWEGMKGSPYITAAVSEMLTRLNVLIGEQKRTQRMLKNAYDFLDQKLVKEAEEMKRDEKKGFSVRPSENAIDILYINAIAGRKMKGKALEAAQYMVDIAEKKVHEYTIYGKARAAVILSAFGKQERAALYLESIKQYSVLTKEMGRYFDTRKAYYSWCSYNIPTEVAAMEAFRRLEPDNVNIIDEMRIWLLQQKRAQQWSTPVNSVDAVYAFLHSNLKTLDEKALSRLAIDDETIDTHGATAGLGYVKTAVPAQDKKTFVAEKTSDGTSWGALYAQFLQPTAEIANASSSISVKREYFCESNTPRVGDIVRVRITIKAERDLDFVEVIDRRAACMEPVQQLSGYHFGYYIAPKDYTTAYYFDRMPKGTHVIEAEYYLDRAGSYSTGSCKAQCAYAPEFSATEKAHQLNVNP